MSLAVDVVFKDYFRIGVEFSLNVKWAIVSYVYLSVQVLHASMTLPWLVLFLGLYLTNRPDDPCHVHALSVNG